MPLFSTYGAWDNDVRKLIEDLSTQGIDKAALTDWFYEEGIVIFQETQNGSYATDVANAKN